MSQTFNRILKIYTHFWSKCTVPIRMYVCVGDFFLWHMYCMFYVYVCVCRRRSSWRLALKEPHPPPMKTGPQARRWLNISNTVLISTKLWSFFDPGSLASTFLCTPTDFSISSVRKSHLIYVHMFLQQLLILLFEGGKMQSSSMQKNTYLCMY